MSPKITLTPLPPPQAEVEQHLLDFLLGEARKVKTEMRYSREHLKQYQMPHPEPARDQCQHYAKQEPLL